MEFTLIGLQRSIANSGEEGVKPEELSVAFAKSYEVTLKKFHNFVVKGVFAVGSGSDAIPSN